MIILDTSFIIALLNSRDVHHKEAVEAIENIGGDEALGTHPLVAQESITVIARKAREQSSNCREWLSKVRQFFEALRIVDFTPSEQDVLDIIAVSNCELSYIDSVLVLESRHLKIPILTFDNALQRMCKT